MSKKSKAQKNTVTISDQYDESSRVLTDEEAHRNVSYELPSFFSQVLECFKVQMKRYTRQRVMWMCIIFLALIPVIYFALKLGNIALFPTTDVANIYMATLLCFGGVTIPLLSSIACGTMLSQEFNERTVYLSLPLPMSRSAFYFGKFLAGLVLIEGVVTAAYGITMILAMTVTTKTYTAEIFGSMLVMMAYVFFCCSLTYFMSTKIRRGSTILPFAIICAVLPILAIALPELISGDWIITLTSYIPTYSSEMAIYSLGDTTPFSIYGMFRLMASFKAVPGKNTAVMMLISIVLGVVLLLIGKKVIDRRDM